VAVAALRFLYQVTLQKAWPWGQTIPTAQKPQPLPVVLSPAEVLQFLSLRARPEASHPPDGLLRGSGCASRRPSGSRSSTSTANGWSPGSNRARARNVVDNISGLMCW
jgi:hypothetical protein